MISKHKKYYLSAIVSMIFMLLACKEGPPLPSGAKSNSTSYDVGGVAAGQVQIGEESYVVLFEVDNGTLQNLLVINAKIPFKERPYLKGGDVKAPDYVASSSKDSVQLFLFEKNYSTIMDFPTLDAEGGVLDLARNRILDWRKQITEEVR